MNLIGCDILLFEFHWFLPPRVTNEGLLTHVVPPHTHTKKKKEKKTIDWDKLSLKRKFRDYIPLLIYGGIKSRIFGGAKCLNGREVKNGCVGLLARSIVMFELQRVRDNINRLIRLKIMLKYVGVRFD